MSNDETPSARYRSLAQECIEAANAFPPGKERNVLLEMAEVWQRLADQYADATPPFGSGAGEQPDVLTLMRDERFQRTMSDEYSFAKTPAGRFKPVDPEQKKEVETLFSIM